MNCKWDIACNVQLIAVNGHKTITGDDGDIYFCK